MAGMKESCFGFLNHALALTLDLNLIKREQSERAVKSIF